MKQRRAVRRRDGAPGREGRLRPRDRGVDLLHARARHLRHHLLRGGLDDLDHSRAHPRARRVHQRRDDAAALVLLGVPQDAERERMVRELDRLDQVVAAPTSRVAVSPSPSRSTP